MANEGQQKFPPQKQEQQPGKEYLMNPRPQAIHPNYAPANKLHGKVALITRGDSGIGRAVAYYYAKEGGKIAFTYVEGQEEEDANETIQKIEELKANDEANDPIAIPADIGFHENCKKVVDKVVAHFGKLDILVNSAAESRHNSIEDISEDQLQRMFRTNIFSYFLMTRHALKHMKGGSVIINTTSVQAYLGSPSSLEYESTKGAIVAFTRGLALQLIDKGIRVNGVAPGPVWTPVQVVINPEDKITTLGSKAPMDGAAQPYEIALSYVFLASEDSSYFTGQVLHPHGGMIVNG